MKKKVNFMKYKIAKETRAQIMSYDLMLAAIILLIIVAFCFSLYNNQRVSMQEQESLNKMHLKAINTFNTILSDQNCSNGGLANEKGVLSQTKIDCFNSMDYNILKQNMDIEDFEFTIKIYDSNSISLQKGSITTLRAVSIQRVTTLNGVAKKGVFVLYEK